MPYRVLVIKADGTTDVTTQDRVPSGDQARKAVGGFIETVPYLTKVLHDGELLRRGTAFCDEEGRLKGKPRNHVAMEHWRRSCPEGDPMRMELAGDVIFYARVK